MNQFQTVLMEHDFIIQYKKGLDMLADYLSRRPATTSDPAIAAYDPFQNDLADLQREEEYAKNILLRMQQTMASSLIKKGCQPSRRSSQKDVS